PFAPSPEVAEPPGREIPGELVLHIERQGDRLFPAGEWAGSPAERLRIEGFAIRPLEAISPGHIEYMGFGPGGRQTPWVTDVKLCGTRGRGYPLTGFAVRLAPALRNQFDVIYEGHFFESGVKGPLRNGEPCLPSIADDPLGAIRLRVVERAGA
ncbi:MAG TPA: glycosyl transferase, partial [Stellaceae bacterium]|nr:glycosyl transferase [Stellaceae bacterium]